MSTQPPTQDDIRSAWNTIAPHFDEFVTPENIRDGEAVLSRLDIGPGTRLLDVCCGSGALSIPAALRGADVTAVDLAPVMIDRLTTRADEAGLVNITPQVADSHALDLPDGHFDVAVSQHGVTMSPAMDKPLAEMARVTRAGGIVLVSAFAPPSEVEVLAVFMAAVRSAVPSFTGMPTDPPPPPFQLADPDTFRSRMTAAELSDVHIERVTERATDRIGNSPVGRHHLEPPHHQRHGRRAERVRARRCPAGAGWCAQGAFGRVAGRRPARRAQRRNRNGLSAERHLSAFH